MGFNNAFGNVQAQTGAAAFEFGISAGVQSRIAQPAKLVKNCCLVFLIDANSAVMEDDLDKAWQFSAVDLNFSAVRSELNRVRQNVPEELQQPFRIAI